MPDYFLGEKKEFRKFGRNKAFKNEKRGLWEWMRKYI